jgi:hypothetical protein
MTIPALPAAPSPTDTPSEFNSKAFAFLAALDPWGDAADALAVTMNADAAAAALSETAAETAAGTATTKAGEASDSAIAAAASAVTAGNAATSAVSAYDQFDERYLGAKTSDPSLDNDGNALITGALYFNSTANEMRVRTSGGTWAAAYIPAEGYLTDGDIGSTVQAYDADLTAWAGKTAPTGDAVGTSDTQTLTNKTISGADNTITVDGTNAVGFKKVPQSASDKTTSYSIATTDVGKFVGVGSGGSITIPDSTFAAGDVVSVYNNTSGTITITCSITTAYIAGTATDKASMTLAAAGVATILFISGTQCVVSGNVV